ncbi:Ku protein [Labrys monachus]|uniref:DNA end-binding protein Ku n=1 Tax=Labrys monachus TaxID=217067 RepID=A0ABU0FA38_9HYPH|nr:Ku protein [Labrys monachus]MDQ0391483.1 DNA end-binding protein Ku [Labrys monachus]
MAPCSTWKGSLHFSFVTCPVSMTPATSGNETAYPFDRVASPPVTACKSTDSIDIEAFVTKDAIDWTWYDKAHYMVPGDPAGELAFSVIRDAMEETGTVAVARLVLYGCERAIMLEPRDMGIVLWTLRRRDDALAQPHPPAVELPHPDRLVMAQVTAEIDKRWKPWHPLQRDLCSMIETRQPRPRTAVQWHGNVIDLSHARRRQASL